MARSIKITQVDAFTERAYAGNPAAVVLEAGGLTDDQMRAIAREMNLSETAFVLPTDQTAVDHKLRWMTPTVEVNFCGHATVATVHAMCEAGMLRGKKVVFETRKGLLPVSVEEGWIWLEPAVPALVPFKEDIRDFLSAVGLTSADVADWASPVIGGERDLLVPCRSLDALRRAKPDFNRLMDAGKARGWRAYCITTLETFEKTSSLHSRFFAPPSGILEDPVTGSVHASLAVYVAGAGKVADQFTAEQGDFVGRPGRLRIEVHRVSPGGVIDRVRVGGRAVTVLRGDLQIP